jgi:hypothetical protein
VKWWRSVVEAWKGKPFGFVLFSTLLLVICVTVSGKSLLQASQGYSDHMVVSFPNHAQAQHARNVAVVAARQDPDVRAAFLKARETGAREDLARARALLARTERAIFRRIAHVRASGVGWGQIAHYYGVHPGVLGLGHSKRNAQNGWKSSMHAHSRFHASSDTTSVRFPNHAQAGHARNLAISAARKDPQVRRAFWRARETGNPQDLADAKALLARTARSINREIAGLRESGLGWGEIAGHYRVHPSTLGLGHSKAKGHYGFERSIPERRPKQTAEAKTGRFKGDRAKENGKGRAVGNGNGHGRGNGKGHGGGSGHGKGNK